MLGYTNNLLQQKCTTEDLLLFGPWWPRTTLAPHPTPSDYEHVWTVSFIACEYLQLSGLLNAEKDKPEIGRINLLFLKVLNGYRTWLDNRGVSLRQGYNYQGTRVIKFSAVSFLFLTFVLFSNIRLKILKFYVSYWSLRID